MYFKLLVSYFGKRYYGAGKQIDKETIQGVINIFIEKLLNENIESKITSRTDKGVNAYEQIIIISCNKNLKLYEEKLQKSINNFTQGEIIVHEIVEIPFKETRKRSKTYLYKIMLENKSPLCFTHAFFYFINEKNVDIYIELLKSFSGKQIDFSIFCKKLKKNTRPTIQELDINVEKIIIDKIVPTINIYISGKCFMYNQIRMIIGTLANIVRKNIKNPSEKELQTYKSVAPAHGLYLYKISSIFESENENLSKT